MIAELTFSCNFILGRPVLYFSQGGHESMAEKKDPKKRNKLLFILIILFSCLFLFSLVMLIVTGWDYLSNAAQSDHLAGFVSDSPVYTEEDAPHDPNLALPDAWLDFDDTLPIRPIQVDFDGLRREGPVEGWLYLPDSRINYPVMPYADQYYLHRSYDGTRNRCGSLFLGAEDIPPAAQYTNTVIHGHRMNDGSMFGELHKMLEQDYADSHQYFQLSLPQGDYLGRVFAVFNTSDPVDFVQQNFSGREDLLAFARRGAEESQVQMDTSFLSEADRLMTLSTCVKHKDEQRLIVMCVLTPIG